VRGCILHLKESRRWAPSSLRQAIAACRMFYCEMLGKQLKLWDVVTLRDRKRLPVVLEIAQVGSALGRAALLRHRTPGEDAGAARLHRDPEAGGYARGARAPDALPALRRGHASGRTPRPRPSKPPIRSSHMGQKSSCAVSAKGGAEPNADRVRTPPPEPIGGIWRIWAANGGSLATMRASDEGHGLALEAFARLDAGSPDIGPGAAKKENA